jgi:phage terminase large subunit-like protein
MSSLSEDDRARWLSQLSDAEAYLLLYDWERFWSRPSQREPAGDWRTWLILAGRGFGKTRAGGEWVRKQVRTLPLVNLIAATADDARDIMIEGESGLLAICPSDEKPLYKSSVRQLHWPNGAKSLIFTADEPDRLRGKQHMGLWCDELAAWRYAESWDQAMLGLRLGPNPRVCVTTTPRPTQIIKDLVASPTTVVTGGSTYENVGNLAPAFLSQIIRRYEGTRMGRQELRAEILDDNPSALWRRERLDELRVGEAPSLQRIVVAVDPSGGDDPENDEQGIVVAGIGPPPPGDTTNAAIHGYCLDDRTCRLKPEGWGKRVVDTYYDWKANFVVAEKNYGGDMVRAVIHSVDPNVPVMLVNASRNKEVRAEPVAALDAQGKIHQVGSWSKMEDELCGWDPMTTSRSPNRLDARVWAFTKLMIDTSEVWFR